LGGIFYALGIGTFAIGGVKRKIFMRLRKTELFLYVAIGESINEVYSRQPKNFWEGSRGKNYLRGNLGSVKSRQEQGKASGEVIFFMLRRRA